MAIDLYSAAGPTVAPVAAQSIGEPGTQMPLKTFHFSGCIWSKFSYRVYGRRVWRAVHWRAGDADDAEDFSLCGRGGDEHHAGRPPHQGNHQRCQKHLHTHHHGVFPRFRSADMRNTLFWHLLQGRFLPLLLPPAERLQHPRHLCWKHRSDRHNTLQPPTGVVNPLPLPVQVALQSGMVDEDAVRRLKAGVEATTLGQVPSLAVLMCHCARPETVPFLI